MTALAFLILMGVPSSARSADSLLRITYLALDHGEATLIQVPGSTVGLLGAGAPGEGQAVIRALKRRGVSSIDMLIGATWSPEHMGGVPTLLQSFPVGRFLYNPAYAPSAAGMKVLRVAREREQAGRLQLGAATMVTTTLFYSPPCSLRNVGPLGSMLNQFAGDPACSLVMEVDYDKFSSLHLGDTKQTHQRALSKLADPPMEGRLLQIGWRAEARNLDPALLKSLKTQIAVLPIPRKSGVKPAPSLLASLRRAGVKVHRTDRDGTITVLTDGRNLSVKTER